jgi:hypothetical protein
LSEDSHLMAQQAGKLATLPFLEIYGAFDIFLQSITDHIWVAGQRQGQPAGTVAGVSLPVGGYLDLELWGLLLAIDYWTIMC